MGTSKSSSNQTKKWTMLIGNLKKVVYKLNFILTSSITSNHWRNLASSIFQSQKSRPYSRHLSFGDQPGLSFRGFSEDSKRGPRGSLSSWRSFSRIRSSQDYENNVGDDVDTRADVFIENFHRQLRMERQISLELRYCRNSDNNGTKPKISYVILV
ncbi:hypothetical protein Cgig2_011398 [Carnegiea gigantea]|uniref:Uncharacterized protein n=1 Tax=Carnegiea gigantea TaxID=171969 RepID=A0A9Q1KST9_9CARY|nr:hypothetical protein Cgig2_011398 [Carnegiea gigantea]